MEALEAQFQAAIKAVDIAGAVIVGSDAKSKHLSTPDSLNYIHVMQIASTTPKLSVSIHSRKMIQ